MILYFWLRLYAIVGGVLVGGVLACWLVGGLIPTDILAYQSVGEIRSDIMLIDISRRLSINLTRNSYDSDINPAWSPDGRYLAFESFGERRNGVYIMDFAGRDVRMLSNSPGAGAPDWSPDGTHIAFTVPNNGTSRIVIGVMVNVDDSQLQPFTAGQTFNYHPAWSPDGTMLVFQGGNYDDYYVYLAAIDNDTAQRVVTADPPWETQADPAWSPDGRRIAFVMRRNIYVVPVDSSTADIQQLTDTPHFNGNPAWSPDSTQLAYDEERHIVSSTTPQQTIRLIHVDGTNESVLVTGARPAWRP